jgi:acyl carrier protein
MLAVLQDAIVAVCQIPRDQVLGETELSALGIDSLAVAEIFVEVEIRLGRELPIDVLRRFDHVKTVEDVARELGGVLA